MRQLDLTDYPVTVFRIDPEHPFGADMEIPYEVRKSLVGVLFSQKNMDCVELLLRDDLARKILAQPPGPWLVEEAEYEKILAAVKAFHGFSQNDVELVRRVMNAPAVQVQLAT